MKKHIRYLLPLGYMMALFCVSSIPGDVMEAAPGFRWITPTWQNLLHIPAYAGLALCWWWALDARFATTRPKLIAAVTLTMMYALVDESWQLYIPGRYGSLTDLALNAIGALLALWFIARRSARHPKN